MVRPSRLVEEGVPIGSTAFEWNDVGNVGDEDMDRGMNLSNDRHSTNRLPSLHHQHQDPPQSSLMRASGGRVFQGTSTSTTMKTPLHTTRFVIGREDATMDHSMDDNSDSGHGNSMVCPPMDHWHNGNHSYHQNHHNEVTSFQVDARAQSSPLHAPSLSLAPRPSSHYNRAAAPATRTHVEIGADERCTEKMQGVEDHSVKEPLVVLDGANVAYAYAHALEELHSSHGNHPHAGSSRLEPNMRGIRVTVDYFGAHIRVLVVLPQSYYRRKPGSLGGTASMFVQDNVEQLQILEELHRQGKLVAAPPTDDDDAYALSIARRENTRATQRGQRSQGNGPAPIIGPAYVLSNDLFRDAQQRDVSGSLRQWLVQGLTSELGPGRISFAFCDLGRLDDHGDPELDIVPNPRHPLITWLEGQHQLQQQLGASFL